MGPTESTISVYPSGADRTTISVPMFPPPPGLLSITNGCFSRSDSCCATFRARMSVVPPAVKATTIRTGFEG